MSKVIDQIIKRKLRTNTARLVTQPNLKLLPLNYHQTPSEMSSPLGSEYGEPQQTPYSNGKNMLHYTTSVGNHHAQADRGVESEDNVSNNSSFVMSSDVINMSSQEY